MAVAVLACRLAWCAFPGQDSSCGRLNLSTTPQRTLMVGHSTSQRNLYCCGHFSQWMKDRKLLAERFNGQTKVKRNK